MKRKEIRFSRWAVAAFAGAALFAGDLFAQTTPAPQPSICNRACWTASGSSGCSSLGSFTRAVIHHTAGQDNTSSLATSKSLVRGHQNYHKNTNGWCDIGYHFLFDKLGNAFEGRYGSMGASSGWRKGAHDGCNANSMGFSCMGYFHSPYNQAAPSAMRNKMYDVIAWRLPSGWSPYGSGTYCSATVGRLGSHRNVKATACPGDILFGYIGNNWNGGEARTSIAARRGEGGGADDRIDVVVRGGGNNIYHKRYHRNNGGWSGYTNIGGVSQGSPAICSWAPGRLDVFFRGTDNEIKQIYYANGQWSASTIGGTLSSDPAAVSWGSGRIDVVAIGGGNNIYHKYFVSGSGWSGWGNLGGYGTSAPTICSRGAGRLNVFVRGQNNDLQHKYYESGSGWSGWQSLGGVLTSAPSAVSRSSGHINVVARGGSNYIYHKFWNSSQGWSSSWENLGGNAQSEPTICSWGSDRLDIFIRGANDQLQQKYWDGSGWSSWGSLGGILSSGPGAVAGQW